MFLAIYLEFAQFSERNFGGIAIGKAASEVTTNFCPRGVPKKCVCRCPRRYIFPLHPTPYTCFICLCLLKGCLPLRGEGSLWQTTGSLLIGRLTGRALIAFLTLQPFKRVLFVFFYPPSLFTTYFLNGNSSSGVI